MNTGVLARMMRLRIVVIAGVVGVMDCGANSRTERTAQPANAVLPADSPNGLERSGSTVVVQTTPSTFVWLEPTFAHEFPAIEGAAYMDQQGQLFMPDTLLVRTGSPFTSAAARTCCTTSASSAATRHRFSTSPRLRGEATRTLSTKRVFTT